MRRSLKADRISSVAPHVLLALGGALEIGLIGLEGAATLGAGAVRARPGHAPAPRSRCGRGGAPSILRSSRSRRRGRRMFASRRCGLPATRRSAAIDKSSGVQLLRMMPNLLPETRPRWSLPRNCECRRLATARDDLVGELSKP